MKNKKVIIVLLIILIILTLLFLRNTFNKVNFADPTSVSNYIDSFGIWGPVISFLMMVIQTLFGILPFLFITVSNGLVFGLWWGFFLSLLGAMVGAIISFWFARWLGKDYIARLVKEPLMSKIDMFSKRNGFTVILIARLAPISSALISYGAGLSKVDFWTFFFATLLGKIPPIFLYTYFGANLALVKKYLLLTTTIFIIITLFFYYLKKFVESPKEV